MMELEAKKLVVVGPWVYTLFFWSPLEALTTPSLASHIDDKATILKEKKEYYKFNKNTHFYYNNNKIIKTTDNNNVKIKRNNRVNTKLAIAARLLLFYDYDVSESNISIFQNNFDLTMNEPVGEGGGGELDKNSHQIHDISDSEWILLETLDCRKNRPLHTGPFLTVQRRRRRRKYVRTYLFKDPTLVDDLSTYQTNFVLDRINNWAFNAFILDNVTGGRPLPNLCVHLFKSYGLIEHFKLDPVSVWKLFSIIEDGYHWRNPYHNAVHAADVTQAMHCFLQENMILEHLTPLEIFCALLAAVTHDLDHPGVNQPFLIATSNHLAALYKNSSVLENHHWRSAMGCLMESGISTVLGPDLVLQVEEQIKSLVLATDITRQKEFLDRLTEYLDTNTLDMTLPEVRHFVLQIALKCADICNPCRPWEISRKWSMKVCEEFFRQGDYERQLNLPVTSLCDRYSISVPKIQTGFFQFVVRPLFTLWHRMMATPLSTDMMENLDGNQEKWTKLQQADIAKEEEKAKITSEKATIKESEIPEHVLDDSDTISIGVAKIAAKVARHEDRIAANSMRTNRPAVHFDPHTTITAASDSEQSEEGELSPETGISKVLSPVGSDSLSIAGRDSDFLGIPRPDGRRHSIATGLMPIPPAQLLSAAMGSSSGGTSTGLGACRSSSSLNVSEMVSSSSTTRMVGRTVIRRESLPSGNLLAGRALPSKTILHLQKLSSKAGGGSGGDSGSATSVSGDLSPAESLTAMPATTSSSAGDATTSSPTTELPVSPAKFFQEKSSCSSSTTDEILDFTYSLPEPGSRSSGSPRRSTLEATDLDELCPGTSILSMSPNVAHFTLQQSIDLEDQRRHLIRQQTCPVVSIHGEGGGKFDRPRFLSAAAAVSPTAVASSSIISQHRIKNKSPEGSGTEEGGAAGGISVGQGRGSGGSSSEAIMTCGVISEEVDRGSGGSSAEASPLEIFVQQFPPGADDNDGEAPRRTSSTGNLDPDQIPSTEPNSHEPLTRTELARADAVQSKHFYESEDDRLSTSASPVLCFHMDDPTADDADDEHSAKDNNTFSRDSNSNPIPDHLKTSPPSSSSSITTVTQDISTQTDEVDSMEDNLDDDEEETVLKKLEDESADISHTATNTLSTSRGTSTLGGSCRSKSLVGRNEGNCSSGGGSSSTGESTIGSPPTSGNMNRLATLLMWKNNRLWRSLTEEDHYEDINPCISDLDLEDNLDPASGFYDRWNVRLTQQNHQGVVGARLQIRRGSAPTTMPTLASRGAQDRRSDPTQYHTSYVHSFEKNNNPGDLVGGTTMAASYAKHAQIRRGSFPIDLMRQTTIRPIPPSNKPSVPKAGRRGSLPTESSSEISGEPPFAYKWMHVFPYSEDDSIISIKRRSSGGPELFAAAQQKMTTKSGCATVANVRTWKAQILIEQMASGASSGGVWPGRRRGSLPVDVYIASSGSCSSESESSAGDASDT